MMKKVICRLDAAEWLLFNVKVGSVLRISVLTFSTAPPSFTATPPQYVEAKEGGSTLLSCSAQGNPKPMISWLREGEELATNTKYSVRMVMSNGRYSDLWLWTNIEAGFAHRWCHPLSPSVLEVCYGLCLTEANISLLCCCAAKNHIFWAKTSAGMLESVLFVVLRHR